MTLKHLDLEGSNVPYLNVNNTSLDYFNVKNTTHLLELSCDDANLDELDLTNCTRLSILKCRSNNLDTLDLTTCINLTQLYCNDNALDTLILDQDDYKLKRLECQNNNLTSLKIPQVYTHTEDLVPEPAYYTHYDEGAGIYREYYWEKDHWVCYDYNVHQFVDPYPLPFTYKEGIHPAVGGGLEYLDCSKNPLSELSLPNAHHLKDLYCYNCDLKELDLSACGRLEKVRLSNNRVASLDLSNNPALVDILTSSLKK